MATDRLPELPKVRYLHGRPTAHPAHARLAEAVGGEFEFVDFRLRWQDQSRSRLRTVASWLVCAATLPRRREHGVFLVDNLHVSPVVMKLLFLRRDQKIVVHLGSHTLYFLQSRAFSYPVDRLHRWALRNYDALLCEGDMAAEIAEDLLGDDCPRVYRTFIGPPADKVAGLRNIDPDPEGRSILFVGSGPAEFRVRYKGLDLMVQAFALAARADPALEFHVVGDWAADIVRRFTADLDDDAAARITFHGPTTAVDDWYRASSIYLHAARGDAFPLASIEAMHAGLIPIVSEWTGTRGIVKKIEPRLVVPLEASAIAERILWVVGLDPAEKRELSRRGRELIASYTAEAAEDHYRRTFATMCSQIGVEGGTMGGQPPPNKAATVAWFLRRPWTYRHVVEMARTRVMPSRRAAERTGSHARTWGHARGMSPTEALVELLGPGHYPDIDHLHPRDVDAAARRVRASGFTLGGPGNTRLLYHLVRGVNARRVIETGVAYGWSSLAILLAQRDLGGGALTSTDMPYPRGGGEAAVGCAIPSELRGSWTLIRRPDRPGLVDAVRSMPNLDLAHYDSDKTYAGQSWAFDLIWAALRPGGMLVADDIGHQAAFMDFANRLHLDPLVVCADGKLIGLARRPP